MVRVVGVGVGDVLVGVGDGVTVGVVVRVVGVGVPGGNVVIYIATPAIAAIAIIAIIIKAAVFEIALRRFKDTATASVVSKLIN